MMRSKKAQIFTLIAIALITLFFVSYEVYSIIQDRQAIKTRISTMDSFLFSLEQNLQREMYITGYRTLFLAENHITKTGNYISDANSFFNEAFFNGTVYGNTSDILVGVRYNDIIDSVNDKASKINVNITMTNPLLSVSQDDPWNLAVTFSFRLDMKDKTNLASWNKQENVKSYISIEGFEDPLYIVNTNARVAYKINRTIYEGIYTSGSSVVNLNSHVQKRLYAASSDAPSFLKRLQGQNAVDENGIESLVDLDSLSAQGISTQQKSVVDHIYFSASNPASSKISGMESWFRLDSAHLGKYNVTNLVI